MAPGVGRGERHQWPEVESMCDSQKLRMSLSFLICQTNTMIDGCALAMQEKIRELQCLIQHLVQVSILLFSNAFYCSASVSPLENEKNDFQHP